MAAEACKHIGRASVAQTLNRPCDVFVVGDALFYVEIVDDGSPRRERLSSEQARAYGQLLIEAADEAELRRAEWEKANTGSGATAT